MPPRHGALVITTREPVKGLCRMQIAIGGIGVMDWLSSKAVTSMVVLVIIGSFLGLFNIQVNYYTSLELQELADVVSSLVAEIDKLTCEATVEVNWTLATESHGLPRYFHGEPYLILFTQDRPHVTWNGLSVKGRYFTSPIDLLGTNGSCVSLLEVPSTTGFLVQTTQMWAEWGLGQRITVEALH